jgi:hypothetical protein
VNDAYLLARKTDSGRLPRTVTMNVQTLSRIQLALASAGALLGGAAAIWSWRVGDWHGLSLALVILAGSGVSAVLTRLIIHGKCDRAA